MEASEYRARLASLGLSQIKAAKALCVNERTSKRYALKGVGPRASERVRMQLDLLEKQKDESK